MERYFREEPRINQENEKECFSAPAPSSTLPVAFPASLLSVDSMTAPMTDNELLDEVLDLEDMYSSALPSLPPEQNQFFSSGNKSESSINSEDNVVNIKGDAPIPPPPTPPPSKPLVIHDAFFHFPRCDFPGCNKVFITKAYLDEHKRIHTEDPLILPLPQYIHDLFGLLPRCDFPSCGKVCITKPQLDEHKRIHTEPIDDPFKFLRCDLPSCCILRAQLNEHKRIRAEEPIDDPFKFLRCDFPSCGKVCLSRAQFNEHKCIHSEQTPSQEGTIPPPPPPSLQSVKNQFHSLAIMSKPSNVSEDNVMDIEDGKSYKCSWEGCERRFFCLEEYFHHYRNHTGYNQFRCRYCNLNFGLSVHLEVHLQLHKDKPCDD